MTIKAGSKVTYHRENFEMAVKFKFLEIERLGIKDYPPIFLHAESIFAIICKYSFLKMDF